MADACAAHAGHHERSKTSRVINFLSRRDLAAEAPAPAPAGAGLRPLSALPFRAAAGQPGQLPVQRQTAARPVIVLPAAAATPASLPAPATASGAVGVLS